MLLLRTGDFFEVPGACPASTTCPVVCVTNVTDCPTVCGDGLTLCTTGNCELDCTFWDDGKLANPCTCTTQTIACPKVVDLFTTCADRFQGFYDENKQCLINDATAVEQLSFTEPWFLVCYYWIIGVSVSVMLWCLYNEKIYPVATSTVPLEAANEISGGAWTQTGYQRHLVGSLIYLSVIFTFAAFQFLLFLLTIFFYMQQGAIDRWPPVFQDEIQVLKAFQIVWMVGIVWCLAFRYPSTGVRALFYRRCSLHQATHVAVVAPIKSLDKVEIISLVARLVFMIWAPIDFILRAIFSYPYDRPGLETAFCRIEKDRESGTRSILHRMRRYIYDETAGGFVPCYVSVGTTLGDFLNQMGGLTVAEANVRRGKRGPNVIPVPKPTILRSISKEFSKTFYLYQNFMVWSWLNFWYYYM